MKLYYFVSYVEKRLEDKLETRDVCWIEDCSYSHGLLRLKKTEPSYEVCLTEDTSATQLRAAVTVGQHITLWELLSVEH